MPTQVHLKVFVSSTFMDLKEHRAQVIKALRRAGFFVDPMEDWTADADEPKAFSQQRVKGCALCILLVAFRRGYIPEGETHSITQLEYEYAREHGINVLPFLLRDDAPWPRGFDEMDKEPGIREWRDALRKQHGCEEFCLAAGSLDVMPAVTRWLKTREQQQAPSPPPTPAEELLRAEESYLRHVAEHYHYIDFKGIEQLEKWVSLPLDEVFVNLKARREDAGRESQAEADDFRRTFQDAPFEEQAHLEDHLVLADVERIRQREKGLSPEPVDSLLAEPGGLTLLGGPGSGKTTLIKRLARSCALGPEAVGQRYPKLPWCLPIVISAALFDEKANGRGMLEFTRGYLQAEGGTALLQAFEGRWGRGECLLLLDGLDEIADTGRRIQCARCADHLIRGAGRNRVLVTSRPVGYSICRLAAPANHAYLEPFEANDITTFVLQWHKAYDKAVHPQSPNAAQAEADAQHLVNDIRAKPQVADLATNPLMLTIVALIRRQRITLPERRVSLYEVVLNTLIGSWNKARSLSGRSIGDELGLEETKKVWGEIAHWMHTKNTGTCTRQQLHDRLVTVLTDSMRDPLAAEQAAESYLTAAAEGAGLLEARGANAFAFMHQTFQEYLAARHLARSQRQAVAQILAVSRDPRWHEAVRLAAGYIGVIREDDEMVTELVRAIGDDRSDPLEPYLCSALRLASSCVADDVRVHASYVDTVLATVCERVNALPCHDAIQALAKTLASLRTVQPGPAAVTALRSLGKHRFWTVRMEAARLLGRSAARSPETRDFLRQLLTSDGDRDVRAVAAYGLWQAGAWDWDTLKALVSGFVSSYTPIPTTPSPKLTLALLKLLEDPQTEVRSQAAQVLGNWGPQAEAVPALLNLLENLEADVGSQAAQVLGNWGPQAEAMPALLKLLENPEAAVRFRAARVLGEWGSQGEAVPVLLKLLGNPQTDVRLQAAQVVGAWGHQAEAVPALLKLLENPQAEVRFQAARVLGEWGPQTQAVPALLKLLEDPQGDVRFNAALAFARLGSPVEAVPALLQLLQNPEAEVRLLALAMLNAYGPQAEAMPALLQLLEHPQAKVRFGAARVLREWGHQAEAMSALLQLLEHPQAEVRFEAAQALSDWDPQTCAHAVIPLLLQEKADQVVAYFQSLQPQRVCSPPAETAQLIARLLQPDLMGSKQTGLIQSIVLTWIWRTLQPG